MRFIAHRGNIQSRRPERENTPKYIQEALNLGYDAEIDVWLRKDKFFLGHDRPQIEIEEHFLMQSNLWIHAKNIRALNLLKDRTNCFFHNEDDCVLTSKNIIWVYPGKLLVPSCVAVLPEVADYTEEDLKKCYAICSDEISNFNSLI